MTYLLTRTNFVISLLIFGEMEVNQSVFPQSAFSKNMEVILPRPNKKIPVFRVTQPYLNLLVKQKKIIKKIYMCLS